MTGSSPGTPSPAAASSGGGSNNNNNNNQRNNNNNNRNNNNNGATSASTLLQKITDNKIVFYDHKSQKGNSPHPDFELIVQQVGAAVSLDTGLKYGPHIGKCIVNNKKEPLKAPTMPKRTPAEADATAQDKEDYEKVYEALINEYAKRMTKHNEKKEELEDEMRRVYVKVFNLMSDEVKFKVQRDPDYVAVSRSEDLIGLIDVIRKVCCGFHLQDGQEISYIMVQQIMKVVNSFQKEKQHLDDFVRQTTSNLNAHDSCGGGLHLIPQLLKRAAVALYPNKLPEVDGQPKLTITFKGLTEKESAAVIEQSRTEFEATLLFSNLNNTRFGEMKDAVLNNQLMGAGTAFPTSKAEVVDLCTRFRSANLRSPRDNNSRQGGGGGGNSNRSGGGGNNTDGLQYAQVATPPAVVEPSVAPTAGSTVGCIHCGEEDHTGRECPQLTPQQRSQLLAQSKSEDAPAGLQLGTVLDTCSEFSSAPESQLTNIRDAPTKLNFSTSAGSAIRDRVGDLSVFDDDDNPITAWVTPSASDSSGVDATILSLKDVKARYRVTYDSEANDDAFLVHTPSGIKYLRPCATTGFPRLETSPLNSTQLLQAQPTDTTEASSAAAIPTIQANYDNFTQHDIQRATAARNLQAMIGNPSEKEFMHLVRNRFLPNCDITTRDITNARLIFGRDLPSLRGKTRRRRPRRVEVNLVDIPRDFMNLYKNITLTADVFFINGIPFLLTLSRQVRFLTVQHVPHRSAGELANSLKLTLQTYGSAGFLVPAILMDGEFDKLCEKLPGLLTNTTAAREHVNEIERMIQTLKGRVRGVRNTLPRRLRGVPLPNLFYKSMVYFAVFWLNAFPASPGVGISTELSPREMVLRQSIDVKLLCRVLFGTYCEVHHEPEAKDTNTMEPRTTEGIAMGPVGNIQGTQKFYDLKSRRIIKRKEFTVMPMPDSIMDLIIQHGEHDKQGNKLNVRNRKNQPFDWDNEDDDEDDVPLVEDNAPEPAPFPAEVPGVPVTSDDIPSNHSRSFPLAIEERREAVDDDNIDAAVDDYDAEAMAIAARENADIVGQNELLNIGFMPDIVEDVDEELEEEGAQEEGAQDEGAQEEGAQEEGAQEEGADIIPVGEHEDNMGHIDDGDADAVVVEDVSDEGGDEDEDNETNQNLDLSSELEESIADNIDEEPQEEERAPLRRSQRGRRPITRDSEEGYEEYSFEQHVQNREFLFRNSNSLQYPGAVQAALGLPYTAPSRTTDKRVTVNDKTVEPIELRDDEMELFVQLMKQTQDRHAARDLQNNLRRSVQAMQVSLQRGIKLWGDKAKVSAGKEMQQMEDYNVMIPKFRHELTREERVRALSTLIFLKEKRDGSIKSRTCVNGAPQREYIAKEDASSPTVMTDAVILTAMIDAWQLRDVATVDLPGAFLHTVTDEKVIVTLRGVLCDLMVQVNPETYRKYVSMDRKGQPILYMQLYKSCYGLLRSALLFYRKLRGELEAFGMKINPYDPCVFNKEVNGNQLTVTLHVDDLKISHVDSFEVTKLIRYLEKIYGKVVVHRGKVHDYLGMDLDFSDEGYLQVGMFKYTDNLIDEFPEELGATAKTPASDNLFKVRDETEAKFLPEEQAVVFHSFTASLLFLSQRARRDIQTAVSFLTTRVKQPDEDDWLKLRRVLRYLKATRRLKLRLKIDNLDFITWLVDASHGVHRDMRGHTGAGLTLGEGAAITLCMKQKMNTRSSTETEIVGVHDALPTILWSVHFLRAQGFDVKHTILKQDNQSAILLEINGRSSSSKRTKHIEQRFFYITDQVEKGLVKIEHEYTDKMWIDVMTKPKQGMAFRVDRSKVMGCPIDYTEESI